MAPRLGCRFAPFVGVFLPPLLQLCARTNKVAQKRAEKTLHLICQHCHLPQVIPYFVNALEDKSSSLRTSAAECLVIVLQFCDAARLQKRVADVEKAIQVLATDAHPQARALCRQLYGLYAGVWSSRAASYVRKALLTRSFFASLSPTAQRYLAVVQPIEPAFPDSLPNTDTQLTQFTPSSLTRVSRVVKSPPTTQLPQSNSDPFQHTSVPSLPARGTSPSDGVAHRLALAREQARMRTSQRGGAMPDVAEGAGARFSSRALARSSTSIGNARRVVVPRCETPRALVTKPAPAPAGKAPSPFATRSQFTPKRRPFNIVNEDRSPRNRAFASDALIHTDE